MRWIGLYYIVYFFMIVSALVCGGTAWVMRYKREHEDDPEEEFLWYLTDRTDKIIDLKDDIKRFPEKNAENTKKIKEIEKDLDEIRKKYGPLIKKRIARDKKAFKIQLVSAGVFVLLLIYLHLLLRAGA